MFTLTVHLNDDTPPEAKEGIRLYWEINEKGAFVNKATEIGEQMGYKGSTALQHLVERHSKATCPLLTCRGCGGMFWIKNRPHFRELKRFAGTAVCNACRAKENESRAQAQKEREVNMRNQVDSYITMLWGVTRDIPIDELTLAEAVYFLSLVDAGMDEDFAEIDRVHNFSVPLAPTDELIVKMLQACFIKLIVPSYGSSLAGFVFKDDGTLVPHLHDLKELKWDFTQGNSPEETAAYVRELRRRFAAMDWPESWFDQSRELWREVALHECLEYMAYLAGEYSIKGSPGAKSSEDILTLLDNFSTAQIYNHIFFAVKQTAAEMNRRSMTPTHQWNYLLHKLRKKGEDSLLMGWETRPYRRPPSQMQSSVSVVLFNTVLQTNGFDVKPS